MIDRPELESRVEDSVAALLRDVFPLLQVVAWSQPGKRDERHLAIMVEDGGEEIPCTGIHSLVLTITARNLSAPERDQMGVLFGDARSAIQSIERNAKSRFMLVGGESVEIEPKTRRAENESDHVETMTFTISAQASELPAVAA